MPFFSNFPVFSPDSEATSAMRPSKRSRSRRGTKEGKRDEGREESKRTCSLIHNAEAESDRLMRGIIVKPRYFIYAETQGDPSTIFLPSPPFLSVLSLFSISISSLHGQTRSHFGPSALLAIGQQPSQWLSLSPALSAFPCYFCQLCLRNVILISVVEGVLARGVQRSIDWLCRGFERVGYCALSIDGLHQSALQDIFLL